MGRVGEAGLADTELGKRLADGFEELRRRVVSTGDEGELFRRVPGHESHGILLEIDAVAWLGGGK